MSAAEKEILNTCVLTVYSCCLSKLFPCSDAIREKMKKNYLSNPSYNYEIVNRASLACGPMVKWAIAQVIAQYCEKSEPEGR